MSQENEVEQEPVVTGPGKVLKEKRESLNLTIEDIAGKLHLRPSIIESLEADNYDLEVSTTFTKGYIRLYAKHLGLDAEPLLQQFDNLTNTSKQPAKLRSFSQKVAKQASDARLMMVTYFIIAVIIGLSVVWWLQQDDDGESSSIPSGLTIEEVSTNEPNRDNPNDVVTEEQDDEPLESFREELVSDDSVDAQLIESATVENNSVEDTFAEPTSDDASVNSVFSGSQLREGENQELPVSVENPAEIGSQIQDGAEALLDEELQSDGSKLTADSAQNGSLVSDASIEPIADLNASLEELNEIQTDDEAYELAQRNAAAAQAMQSGVVFTFAQDCWVSITDATGEVVAIGIKTAGRVMPVPGIAPFEVVLGAPKGVSLTVDGVPFDMSQFPAGRTARFTVTRESASEIGG
ncbi:MAG: DUF4115 domain-containing protein [Alteromonadaceae bacterium]|nr:DUF4115 domain-containing protein [Alteromonadaceae bacterium]